MQTYPLLEKHSTQLPAILLLLLLQDYLNDHRGDDDDVSDYDDDDEAEDGDHDDHDVDHDDHDDVYI